MIGWLVLAFFLGAFSGGVVIAFMVAANDTSVEHALDKALEELETERDW